MKLHTNSKYTNSRSDLYLHVHAIYYESSLYYKIKGTLINKRNGISYGTKGYKINKTTIGQFNWRRYGQG